jgi:hypothetical protein
MFRPRAVCSLVTLATLGACIEPAIERCADGSLCPSDLVCDPAGGCVAEQLLTQCEDAADGAACDFLGGVEGVCAGRALHGRRMRQRPGRASARRGLRRR